MNRRNSLPFAAMAALFLGAALQATAQSAKDQLVGTWMLVSIYGERQDGSKFDPFGANPTGILMFDDNGRFAAQLVGSGLPKFASNSRLKGTPEENKAIVQGSICYFGTYSVSEADNTLNYHIESSSFPNFNGTDQKLSFTHIKGDEMEYTAPSSTGGTSHVVWKRAK
jgi:Lipocalin-like domain